MRILHRKVYIFKNIKNKRWTIYDYETKKHLGYRSRITLLNCQLEVINHKRKAVKKSGKRFPHAWIIGFVTQNIDNSKKEITYNPFKDASFKCEGKKLIKAHRISFFKNGRVFK